MPRSPWCGRWKACLDGGRLQRISVHFWIGNTTQMSSIDLGRTLQKLLAVFRTFQHQFSPDGNKINAHAAALSPPSWNVMHTVVDVHPRASTERMRGDADLRFCTYTCTELSRVPLCCHFATYYNFPEKFSPGIKLSAHVIRIYHILECIIPRKPYPPINIASCGCQKVQASPIDCI